MRDGEIPDLRSEAESLIDWWRDAGVDVLIDEEPRDWLAEAKKAVASSAQAGAVANSRAESSLGIGSRPSQPVSADATPMLPDSLPAFIDWLATETDVLASYPVRQRVAPQGDPASDIMIVTDVPERGDAEAGMLLTGEVGALFDRMLAGWKVERSDIYLAALAPARPARPILDESETRRLAPLIVRHIALAAPKKLWLLGDAASRAVLGMSAIEATGRLHFVNYDDTKVVAIATLHPRVLLREPKSKARVWADMQRLSGDLA